MTLCTWETLDQDDLSGLLDPEEDGYKTVTLHFSAYVALSIYHGEEMKGEKLLCVASKGVFTQIGSMTCNKAITGHFSTEVNGDPKEKTLSMCGISSHL